MSVIVYIWSSKFHDHASIDVAGTYISFHPSDPDPLYLKPLTNQSEGIKYTTYSEDVAKFGRQKNTISISNLDIGLIGREWDHILEMDYRLWTNNCSTVVAKLLRAGTTVDDSILFQTRLALTKVAEIFVRNGHSRENLSEKSASFLSRVTRMPKSIWGRAAVTAAGAAGVFNSAIMNPHEVAILAEMIRDSG
jgi:hypothetical protein